MITITIISLKRALSSLCCSSKHFKEHLLSSKNSTLDVNYTKTQLKTELDKKDEDSIKKIKALLNYSNSMNKKNKYSPDINSWKSPLVEITKKYARTGKHGRM